MTFEIGDTVEMLSGGPVMTISGRPSKSKLVSCEWFVGGNHHWDAFEPAMLRKVDQATIDAAPVAINPGETFDARIEILAEVTPS
jgi:uncharacterized protein YodC (DUF2158 family)